MLLSQQHLAAARCQNSTLCMCMLLQVAVGREKGQRHDGA
jgi:hypothetical protein